MNKTALLSGLYAITDPGRQSKGSLLKAVDAALHGGLRIVQYRNKTLEYNEQLNQTQQLKKSCDAHSALLIINDDVRLAHEVQAGGLHLGRDDVSLKDARELLGDQVIIGCSCYNDLDRALWAQQQGADYVAFGRFFPSKTKPEATPATMDVLTEARTRLDIPVCAIGGITLNNAPQLIDQGVDMIAVIHDLFSADNIEHRTRQFVALFK